MENNKRNKNIICKKCKFAKFNEDKTSFQCLKPIAEQETVICILRHFYWLLSSNQQLGKKAEKLIDRTINEMNEGEEWKNPQ